jgi:hypothetical protein
VDRQGAHDHLADGNTVARQGLSGPAPRIIQGLRRGKAPRSTVAMTRSCFLFRIPSGAHQGTPEDRHRGHARRFPCADVQQRKAPEAFALVVP